MSAAFPTGAFRILFMAIQILWQVFPTSVSSMNPIPSIFLFHGFSLLSLCMPPDVELKLRHLVRYTPTSIIFVPGNGHAFSAFSFAKPLVWKFELI